MNNSGLIFQIEIKFIEKEKKLEGKPFFSGCLFYLVI